MKIQHAIPVIFGLFLCHAPLFAQEQNTLSDAEKDSIFRAKYFVKQAKENNEAEESIGYLLRHQEEFPNTYEVSIGAGTVLPIGNIASYVDWGVDVLHTKIQGSIKRFAFGIDAHILAFHKKKDFPILDDYEHYDVPAALYLGGFGGVLLGKRNIEKGNFQLTLGVGWLALYYGRRSTVSNSGTAFNYFAPSLEISKPFKIGKIRYAQQQYMGYYTYVNNPNISIRFLELFLRYTPLLHKQAESSGHLLSLGVRFQVKFYSLSQANIKR